MYAIKAKMYPIPVFHLGVCEVVVLNYDVQEQLSQGTC